jgi:hypothetical protein
MSHKGENREANLCERTFEKELAWPIRNAPTQTVAACPQRAKNIAVRNAKRWKKHQTLIASVATPAAAAEQRNGQSARRLCTPV